MEKKINCFLVEDDMDDQEIFLMCLKNIDQNIFCRIASNGEEAVQILEEENEFVPDCIFLDVNMPKMNGLECLQKIKQINRLARVKVFMYSTTSEKKVVARTQELGAEEFIVKPTKTAELKEKLSKIFSICRRAIDDKNK